MPVVEMVSSPAYPARKVFPLQQGVNIVGRDPGCDIEIPDPKISAKHMIILLQGERAEIVDQNSTNGVFLGEIRVSRSEWRLDQPLYIGDCELRLVPDRRSVDRRLGFPAQTTSSKLELNNSLFDFNIVRERKVQNLDAESSSPDQTPQVKDLLQRMRVTNKLIRSLNALVTVPELFDKVMTTLFEVLHCDTGYILLIDPSDHETVSSHLAFEKGERRENLEEKLYSRTLVSKVLQDKSGFLFDSAEGAAEDASLSIVNLKIRNALVCPIHSEGQVFGVLYLDNKSNNSRFTGEDLDLTMNAAGIAGIAIENIQLAKQLRTEALIRDNLKRFLSPNIADKIISEKGSADFHLGSRKKNITVLFADIRGFTPLSETLAPLDVARMLNLYFSEMCAIVFANGGTLDKFIGDCMMVLFNAPFAVHNPEFTAVKTAQAMRKRLREMLPLWTTQGIPHFEVGIGVNSGEAVVGSLGTEARMEYTALGDCVNIASRVCGLAQADELLITESVYEALQGAIPTRSLGATQLKGRVQSVNLYEVLDPPG